MSDGQSILLPRSLFFIIQCVQEQNIWHPANNSVNDEGIARKGGGVCGIVVCVWGGGFRILHIHNMYVHQMFVLLWDFE